ncbi:[FeFe] hydrogenase, group A [Agathobacter sp.]
MEHLSKSIRVPIELDNPSICRDEELCIKCGMCKNICTSPIGVHEAYTFDETNGKAICINCGQCSNICPVSSIKEVEEYRDVWRAVIDPEKIVIVTTSPSVRVSLAEEFGWAPGVFVQERMIGLLRALGADYVLDTNFSADLTIMEEANELVQRIITKDKPLPQFTSCCPAWVKYVETFYPEFTPNLSTAKSPIGMQGPTIKTYFAKKMGIDPKKIVNVALTPCTAKKMEIRRDEMNASGQYWEDEAMRDMDYVITTRELAKWTRERDIDFNQIEESSYDKFMGDASGAGVIFGNTGGVMEAALRTAYHIVMKEDTPNEFYQLTPVRGYEQVREASIKIGDIDLKIAVIHGTENAGKVLEAIKSGETQYDFVEVMTCPGGCIGGGGQPKHIGEDMDAIRKARINAIYSRDEAMTVRLSYQNPEIQALYKDFYGEPLSELSEKMLHTTYANRSYK